MIDIKFLRENPDVVKENIKKKFQDYKLPLVDEVLELDAKNREAKLNGDDLRSKRIELTDLSKNINNRIKNSFKKFDEMIIKDIDSSDLEIFFKVCSQIQNNLKGENYDKNI